MAKFTKQERIDRREARKQGRLEADADTLFERLQTVLVCTYPLSPPRTGESRPIKVCYGCVSLLMTAPRYRRARKQLKFDGRLRAFENAKTGKLESRYNTIAKV